MDIFCQAKIKLKKEIIKETKNFYLLHDGYPLLEGHLLIIPKKHLDCFFNIKHTHKKELEALIKETSDFLRENYCEPVMFEHGVVAQTVPHAHLHLLPTKISILRLIKKHCSELKKQSIPYLFYFEKKEMYFRPTIEIPPGFLHSSFSKALKRPLDGTIRAKDAKGWILKVKKNWKRWQQKQEK